MTGAISFNSNNLQTYTPTAGVGILCNVIDHADAPDAVYDFLAVANSNHSSMGDLDSASKTIPVAGAIKGSSQSDPDARIDAFKGYLNGKDKNLDINYNGVTRRYTATAPSSGIKIKRNGALLYATFTVQFLCSDPYGRETTLTSIMNQANYTSSSYTATPTIGGSAPYQLPIFTLTLDALTGTGDYLQISNNSNNQAILLFGLGLAAGDVVVIDCEKREVTINGDLVDYSGVFLELPPGAASISYTDGFTTRQVDIVGGYYKRYS